jgi:predicted DNA-binding transcriptional regulator AlpA
MNKTTTKVKRLLQLYTYEEMANMIGISRTTLYKRLQCNDWKVSEISHIEKL